MTDAVLPPGAIADGEFPTFITWVNKATSWIGGENALCVDAKGRECRCGADFMRARDENAFPVSYYFGLGGQSHREQNRSVRLAIRRRRRA